MKKEPSYTLDKVLIFGLLMAAALSKWYVIPSISLGDILLALGLLTFIFFLLNEKYRVRIYSATLFLIACFCIWAMLGALFMVHTTKLWFSTQEFLKSFVKLIFYSFSAVFVISYLSNLPNKVIEEVLIDVVFLNAVVAIYIQVVMNFNLNLPYKFFWFDQPTSLISNAYYRTTGIAVARGIFPEASLLGIFLNMSLAYLYCFRKEKIKHESWKVIIIILAILLSLSFTAYGLLILNMLLFLIKRKNFKVTIICLLLGTMVITGVFVLGTNITIAKQLAKRTKNVVSIGDSSANARLIGSWEAAIANIKNSPFFGAGLGNFENSRRDINGPWTYVVETAKYSCFNSVAYVLGALGIVGFLLFLILIGDLIVYNWIGGVMLFVSMFGHNDFLAPSVWIFYALFRALNTKAVKGFEIRRDPKYPSINLKIKTRSAVIGLFSMISI